MSRAANEHGLTEKQESFCHEFIKTGNASEAYRNSYDAGKMKPESVHRKAHEVLENVKVSARIESMRKTIAIKRQTSIEDLLNELEQARTMALAQETPQSSAAVAATMGKAKMLGFLTDKVDVSGALDHSVKVSFVKPGKRD